MGSDRYGFELARSRREIQAYFELRQTIFCQEQGLFTNRDQDEIDAVAYPIVALNYHTTAQPSIIGVVRIYETEPRLWYGGRLGVHAQYRRSGQIGKGLIYKAVTTANTWGCDRFLATVQLQNVRFFQRLHWESIEEITVCGHPHHLMVADLNYYPPQQESRPVLPLLSWNVPDAV